MVNKIGLEPTRGNIIAEPVESESTTAGGIILPNKSKSQRARVLAVGEYILPNDEKGVPEFGIGDTVIFKKFDVWETKIPGIDKPLLFLKFSDILAVEEK